MLTISMVVKPIVQMITATQTVVAAPAAPSAVTQNQVLATDKPLGKAQDYNELHNDINGLSQTGDSVTHSTIKPGESGMIEQISYSMSDFFLPFLQVCHALALVLIVGSSFFVLLGLTRSTTDDFDDEHFARFWLHVLSRYILLGALSGLVLIVTSYIILYFYGGFFTLTVGGFSTIVFGFLMALVFLCLVVFPFSRLRMAVSQNNWQAAKTNIKWCRRLIMLFLVFGLVVSGLSALAGDNVNFE